MLNHAVQFAENYQANAEKLSARTQGSVRHPSLYIFAGKDSGGIFPQIQRYAARSHAAFFLDAGELELSGRSLRQIKTEIQKNEAGLNLKRINISVIFNADEPASSALEAVPIFEAVGRRIREIFEEDIAVVHVTLFLLLSESNKWDDYEQRAANTYNILKQAEKFQRETAGRIFDRVFVLSDRNEHDTVSDANMENNARIVAGLHSLLNVGSRFEENLNKKSLDEGKTFFATAGMARLEKPYFEIAFAVYKRVAERVLESYRETITSGDKTEVLGTYLYNRKESVQQSQIISKMQSVASRDVSSWQLRGKTLREAEAMLYGDGAERFFRANYKPDRNFPAEYSAGSVKVLEASLQALNQKLESYENQLENIYRKECKPGLLGGVSAVKRMIAEAYGARYKAETVQEMCRTIKQALERRLAMEKRLKVFVKELSKAVAELSRRPDPGQHITAYYGKAVDTVLVELAHGLNNAINRLLNETAEKNDPEAGASTKPFNENETPAENAGGYFNTETDMDALAKKISAFIEKNIWPHEAFDLTFDDDLRRRSLAMPGEYDSGFVTADEFYRRTLMDLDRQSALAVSLIRYDHLYREKYYFGSADSPLTAYAGQERSNEAVYTLEEPSGFMVIRLAGGFTVEDMTRHKIMLEQSRKNKLG